MFERISPPIYTRAVRAYACFMSAAGTPALLARQLPSTQPFTVEFRNYTSQRFRNSRLQLCGDDMPALVSLLEQRLLTL